MTDAPRVLVVDDEDALRSVLERALTKLGYRVTSASSGAEALQVLPWCDANAMICDVRMPGLSGIDVVARALEIHPELPIIMLSGVGEATMAALCIQRGASDYLVKPFDLPDLVRMLRREIALPAGGRPQKRLERVLVATLQAIVNTIESKDPNFLGHSARVADLSAALAAEIGLADDVVEAVQTAGRLHDLGMVGVRDSIRHYPGSLSPDEIVEVQAHVTIGAELLAPLLNVSPVVDFVRHHHERWDGKGYPTRLSGDTIPIGARIIGTVEVYDALTHDRPQRAGASSSRALEQMSEMVGAVLEPRLHDALATVVSRRPQSSGGYRQSKPGAEAEP
ncbi:MAG: response regulator [Gemmatimonadales bacterium]|nr:response regulator [Gemmatimonadales bacterium]